MAETLLDRVAEVFVSTAEMSVAVSRALRRRKLRKLGSRLYTRNFVDPPEQIVRRHLWPLVASYVPGALIADRTALENAPAADGLIFVVSERKRDIELPGLTIRPRRGATPLATDRPFIGGLFLSSTAPKDVAGLSDLLRSRHATIMAGRPDKQPGSFKSRENRAGSTVSVAPDLVAGTLCQGFELYRGLESPFARAVYMMFLVAEVHPFADGNGRVARVMMNAELVSAGEGRILIPTIYRNNYLAALKALSQTGAATPLVRTLDYAQRWALAVPWGELRETRQILETCNAFVDPGEADQAGIRLQLPPAFS